jgi:hypothetical protein
MKRKNNLSLAALLILFAISILPCSAFAGTIVAGGLWVGSLPPDFYVHFRATQQRVRKLAFTGVAACLTKDTGETFNKQIVISQAQTPAAISLRNGRARGRFVVRGLMDGGNVNYDIRLAGSRGSIRLTYWYDLPLESCNLGPVKFAIRRSRA